MEANPNRDGWSQSGQTSNTTSNPSQPPSGPNGAPVLPPPQASFFSGPPPAHNLPGIAGLTQASQSHPSQPVQHTTSRSEPGAPSNALPVPQPPTSHGFSAINQHQSQSQSNMDAERERMQREMEEIARREAEQRDLRERQFREQQQHEPQIIHQPVAVPPNVRSIHGPNGLLGNPNAAATSSAPGQSGVGTSQGLFPGAQIGPDHNVRTQQPAGTAQPAVIPFGQSAVQSAPMNQAQQPILNDALSYLDQVKVQFADHPDVYNRFLDIMKDFKSGAIDTPGVIERVSQLFAGNPALIQGFNTFLPPGYKIECGAGNDPNAIRVTTPMGTTVSTMPAPRPVSPMRGPAPNGAVANPPERAFWHQQQPGGVDSRFSPDGRQNMAQPVFANQGAPTSHPTSSPEVYRQQQAEAAAIHRVEQQNVAQLGNAAAAASGRDLSGRSGLLGSPGDASAPIHPPMNGVNPGAAMMVNGGMEKRGPVEFNHAISYVNKIKNRFAQQPDIYKQFLEILQTYQRESKPIQDVYAQVTRLFETAPDLLEDFKQFLPESAASNQNKAPARSGGEDAFPLSSTRNEPTYIAAASANSHLHQTPRPEQHHRLPPIGNFAPTPSVNRDNKRKRSDRQGGAPSITPIAPEVNNVAGRTAVSQQPNGNKRLKQTQPPKQAAPSSDMSTTTPSLIPPALPLPLPPAVSLNASTEDFSFFDRIRKHIGNKSLWAEFLKLLNLYKHDFIDLPFLVFKAQAFIGSNPDLMQQFKDYLKYKDSEYRITNEPQTVNGRIQLSNCRGLGPSYRLLPKLETNKKCSGRDDLCNSVLNDDWVSHPTWASEDSGFVAHRKNAHEEGLHRVEEERHDYDFYIESCRRSIQLLEPIAQGLTGLTPEQRMNFQLDPKLGGQSEAIYRRVIYKIYGREKGNEVIRELFRRPYDVIPTLLARMKTQCEQWKAAQIQWEKVWRAQTDALFWKSLDHQGAATRVADKRQFFAKQLINEIQVKYQEQKRQRELNRVSGVPNWHFSYSCEDKQILRDSAGLIILYAEQNYSTEHPTLVRSIKELLTQFFLLDSNELDQESFAQDMDIDMDGQSETGASPRQRPAKGGRGGLLRGVLDKTRRRDAEDSESRSRQSTPDEPLAEMSDAPELSATAQVGEDQPSTDKWFTHPTDNNILDSMNLQPNEPYKRTVYNMYSNAAIYCFMRLFGILVERLEKIKANEENVREDVKLQKERKAAHELGWISKEPSHYFANTDPGANYYAQMLDLFKGMIRQDVDNAQVEDTLRRYYLQDGWQLYSLDKLLGALNKFAMGIFFPDAKEKTPEIYALFKKDRQRGDVITHKDEVHYRRSVDRLAREGEIYRIGWDVNNSRITIQLIKSTDPTFETSLLSRAEAWKVYISSYETVYPTEGVDHSLVRLPILKRNLKQLFGETGEPTAKLEELNIVDIERMQFRISASTYRMEVEPFSTDFIANFSGYRVVKDKDAQAEAERRGAEVEERFRANSEWMKGRSKDEVDAKKQEFAERFNQVIEPPRRR
ncbi:hypothetical protein, variant [Verruconis gallopava]|uniref:Histone deacetylase interacting domain-containing protein n=1 Tax=Verruconis gallopava TaxID=253628 RepID=A0A0D2ALC8_9PEZI|nr:uncharacterized protein PV09_01515 [Verruconis gallopava]XP_016217428.1 hypothetical protein, variant [Verruconis gallopava]KIW07558.1 hypothetical protein PV09_01515 [Verruconis gallopava]KIW07559.1 hypothetical protein, variant [Verruconis gallopava]